MYQAVFSSRAHKAFMVLPLAQARRVRDTIQRLMQEPRTHGAIKLDHAPAAKYRYRVSNSRILFDIDDRNHIIELLDIRKRDEQTYK